ncbi:MAG: RNA-binding domain-containing protein [Fervidicoccaceae archaeon]
MTSGANRGCRASSLEIAVIQHATESREKILAALALILPPPLMSAARAEERRIEGHYGNPISYLRWRLEGEKACEVLEILARALDEASRSLLRATARERVEGASTLHLRLHKHELGRGRAVLWEGDETVKIVARFRSRRALDEFIERLSSV